MAMSKDDIKYGTSQARDNSEDEAVRVAYVHGTPLEAGKIAESQPVDLFSSAHNIPKSGQSTMDSNPNSNQSQMQRDETQEEGSNDFTTGAPRLPHQKGNPPTMGHKF